MSSLEEERLVQMVEDFIESESPSPIFSVSSKCLPLIHHTQYLTLQEILGSETQVESEVLESVLRQMRSKRVAEKTSLKKWLVMRLKSNGYNASLCQTSWVTSLGCPGGDYEFIEITMGGENGDHPPRLIVDMDFKSQFELARPTPTYKELTDTLPHVFVGTEDKLNKIISLLCSAAKQSLREKGLHIPPWRTATYMQSKWLAGRHRAPGENREAKAGAYGYSKWAPSPPMVKPKRGSLTRGSALSSQFSEMSINCC